MLTVVGERSGDALGDGGRHVGVGHDDAQVLGVKRLQGNGNRFF